MAAFGKSEREIWVGIGLSLGVTLTMSLIFGWGGFQWLELHTYDMRMNLRGTLPVTSPILLVLNDEGTLTHLGVTPGRVSRTRYAQAIQNLHKAQARVIVLDIMFTAEGESKENQRLIKAMRRAGNVILARYIGPDRTIAPLPIFQEVAMGEGLINVIPDSDGVLRSLPFLGMGFQHDQLRPFLTLGAEAGRLYLDPEGNQPLNLDVPGFIKVAGREIPIEHNKALINFVGPAGTVPSIPFWKIVKGDFSPDQVAGKIVLLGSSAATMQDFHFTPLTSKETKTLKSQTTTVSGTRMPGVEVHANLLHSFLTNQFIVHSPNTLTFTLMGLLGVVCCLVITLLPRGEWGVVFGVLGILGVIIGLGIALFIYAYYWLDLVPLIAIVNGHFALATAYQRYLVVRKKNRLEALLEQREEA